MTDTKSFTMTLQPDDIDLVMDASYDQLASLCDGDRRVHIGALVREVLTARAFRRRVLVANLTTVDNKGWACRQCGRVARSEPGELPLEMEHASACLLAER